MNTTLSPNEIIMSPRRPPSTRAQNVPRIVYRRREWGKASQTLGPLQL